MPISLFKRLSAAALAASLTLTLAACQMEKRDGGSSQNTSAAPPADDKAPSASFEQEAAVAAPDIIRGVQVSSLSGEYPGDFKMDKDALKAAAESLASWAKRNSFNAIFYEVTPGGAAIYPSKVLSHSSLFDFFSSPLGELDPLEELIRAARGEGVAVYAAINPYEAADDDDKHALASQLPDSTVQVEEERCYRPDSVKVHNRALLLAGELAEKYSVAGIVLNATDDGAVSDYPGFYTYLSALVSDMRDVITSHSAKHKRTLQLGLALSSRADKSENRTAFIDSVCRTSADFIAPVIHETMLGGQKSPYAGELAQYAALAGRYQKDTFAVLPVGGLPVENYQTALLIGNSLGLSGGVMESYTPLVSDSTGILQAAIPLMYIEGSLLPDLALDIPTEFRLTRPLDGKPLKVASDWTSYFITGTSDPTRPLYLDDTEIVRISDNGAFGALVELEEGENTFSFRQGNTTLTATINRPEPGTVTHISKISTYTSGVSTVFQPYGPQAVTDSIPMLFQCTAPSGGRVVATLDGVEYELKQVAAAEDGVPAVYKKETLLPQKDPDAVVSLGAVTYTLEFGEETSEVQAPGEVFRVGQNRKALCRVQSGIGTVLNPTMQAGDFMTTLKPGSLVEITGQTANYFKTAYGGFIQKIETSIVTDLPDADNSVTSLAFLPADEKGDERFVLHGDKSPSFVVEDAADGGFTVRFISTYGVPSGGIAADSRFFSSVEAENDNGSLRLVFTRGGSPYFGYNISYQGGDTIVTFYEKPRLSQQRARPLLGLTIVVDAGHGAQDPGAMGVAGESGPIEKDVNLYAAHVTAKLLEGLGADVKMTRESDEEFLTIEERVKFTEAHEADFFLSMHHNSLDERIDGNKREGAWMFYYNDISQGLSDMLLKNVSAVSGRKLMASEKAWYVVCRNTLAPSILLELGFMPNPREYEQICNSQNMLDIARSVSNTLIAYIESLEA